MTFRLHAIALATASAFALPCAVAQPFLPGHLVVSRTVYAGSATTVTVGQSLPGGGKAIADGSFPNVFKNETPDPSFGVSSPIFLDQLTRSGSLVSSLAIDPSLVTTSFASKSELALNLSSDGKSITFMGYRAPLNALDVSNSNTSAIVDPTNPVKSSYQRAIATVGLNGQVAVTGVNAYSGNNGRAVTLADGNYYMVGNAGNSGKPAPSGTVLSQLSDNTGVQMLAAGQSGNTTVVGQVQGSFGSSTGYQRGFSVTQSGQAADKTGKDDNFRGLTMFNNTLYVSKGSGGNGVNTVYQVGTAGQLPSLASASTTAITPLAGFPTTGTATHPFGLWFGDASTLFVADEGDGAARGTPGKDMTSAGLGEFKLVGGVWQKVATFQSGLLDQPSYTAGLPWSITTDGLRNLTGTHNADGSFTLFATTSTVSNESSHDQGADPNELVSITIGANSTAANTVFSVLETAPAGQRFGGVVITPVPEPETYALLVMGLGGVAAVARRRKN